MAKNTNRYAGWTDKQYQKEIDKLKNSRYGLVWSEDSEKVVEQCREKLPVLKEKTSSAIITEKNQSPHILIEGDNYHALSVLNYTHKRKFDFIYIDPPYNTGNETWKYNNRYVKDEDPFKHSKWISFMNHRLKLATNLLKRDGIICITIDNYEVHNIRHLLEKRFPNKEIIITIIEHNYRGRAKSNFALTHEYAVWGVPKDKETITRLKEKSQDIKRNLRRTGQGSHREESPSLFYGIEVNQKTLEIISATKSIKKGEKLPATKNKNTVYIWPIDTQGIERRWYYGSKTMLKEAKEGNVWAKLIKDKIEIHYWKPGKEKRRKSVWTGPKYDGSTYGSELLTEIIGDNDFPFPKSIHAVMECIESATDKKDALILDFFAGSGTVGHAVLELNKKDNGNRKFVVCTNNENGICEEITYPRLKNVIKGYKFKGKEKKLLIEEKITLSALQNADQLIDLLETTKTEKENDYDDFDTKIEDNTLRLYGIRTISNSKIGLGGNLKYFQTDFVDGAITDKNKKNLVDHSTEMLCLKENCFDLVVDEKYYKIFKNHLNQYLGIVYHYKGIDSIKSKIKKIGKSINVYVFSLDDDPNTDEFEEFGELVSLEPIPATILNVYKEIFR